MQPKAYVYKSGASVLFERYGPFWKVLLRGPSGELLDKMMIDDYRAALRYVKAFRAVAKNA